MNIIIRKNDCSNMGGGKKRPPNKYMVKWLSKNTNRPPELCAMALNKFWGMKRKTERAYDYIKKNI